MAYVSSQRSSVRGSGASNQGDQNMVRLTLILAFSFYLAPISTLADITCTATTPLAAQNRTRMKHRIPPATNPGVTLLTVEQVVTLPPATGVTQAGFRTKDSPLDTQESQVATVKGDLWRVNVEANDCDFHLEISRVGASSADDRIIVEIPQGPRYVAARNALLQTLAAHGVKLNAQTPLSAPIHVQVLGFAFYDAWHFSKNDPQRGRAHGSAQVGSLWEIHPVFAIIFPQN